MPFGQKPGDVFGDGGSSTDNEIVTYDGTSGQLVQSTSGIIADGSTLDLNGQPLILDADGDTSIDVSTDDVMVFDTGGSEAMRIDASQNVFIGGTTGVDTVNVTGDVDIIHTAAESDDHALEIECDAAGFGDVKAIDVVYTTGAIAAGEDEEILLANIDESASTDGRVVGVEILATDEGSATIDGLEVGAGINVVRQLSGSFGNADTILVLAVDQTTALSSGGAGNISVFVSDNDTITIGSSAKFEEIEFIFDTVASGSGIAPTWEYSTGVGTWATFSPADGTNGMRNNGVAAWDDGDIPSWATGTGSEYLIQITRTRNSLSTTPILDLIQVVGATVYSWDANGDIVARKLTAVSGVDTVVEALSGQSIDLRVNGTDVVNVNSTGLVINETQILDMNGEALVFDLDGDTSIQASTDDVMVFDTGGSEAMRIDASQNVIIGEGNNGSTELYIKADDDNSNEDDTPRLIFEWDGGGSSGMLAGAGGAGDFVSGGGTNDFTIKAESGICFAVNGTAGSMTSQNGTLALGITSTGAATFYSTVDMGGNELRLDADADTSITANTDDQIDFKTGGADRMDLTDTALTLASGVDLDVDNGDLTFKTNLTGVSWDIGDSTTNADLDFPGVSTANCTLRIFRTCNTSGAAAVEIFAADGTSTSNHKFFASGNYTGSNVSWTSSALTLASGVDLTVADDTDASTTLGRCLIDSRSTDFVFISHRDFTTTSDYGLSINSSGKLRLNSASGQTTSFRINNTEYVNLDTSKLDLTGIAFKIDSNTVVDSNRLIQHRSYTVATVPTGAAGKSIYVSDETGGATLAFYNGSNWVRVSDLATVS